MSGKNIGVTAPQLARYMVASAIYQIGGELEQEARDTKFYDSSPSMATLIIKAEKMANDIIEICATEPFMFFTMITMGVASAMIHIIQERGEVE